MLNKWTPQEIEIMHQWYSKIPAKKMEELLPQRKKASIHKKAEQLGLRGYIKSEWSQEDIASLIQNYKQHTVDEMVSSGLCSGRSKSAIKKKILTLGLEKRLRWSESEEQILLNNYIEKPVAEIRELLPDKDYYTITSHAKLLGLKKHPSSYRIRHNYQRDFFRVPDTNNSYFAGFTAADGSVDKERGTFSINIHIRDIEILQTLVSLVEFSGNIEIGKRRGNMGIYHYCRLYLSSAYEMVEDLKNNFNIVPNKTLILEPPTKITYENALAFIVGLTDGDGSIFITKPDKKGRQYLVLSIAGTKRMLEWVKSLFDSICSSVYGKNASVHKIKHAQAYSYSVGGNRAYNILKTLQAVKVPCRLERKWGKIKEYEQLVGIKSLEASEPKEATN